MNKCLTKCACVANYGFDYDNSLLNWSLNHEFVKSVNNDRNVSKCKACVACSAVWVHFVDQNLFLGDIVSYKFQETMCRF